MRKTLLLFLITLSLSGSFALQCAKDLAGQTGTCINETYYMRFTGVYAYYGCTINVDNTWWYYENCTGTVSSATITADSGEIIAEAWSNDAGKVSACKGYDSWMCNVYPLFGFKTDTTLAGVGYCDSSGETCVKCAENNTQLQYFTGNAIIDANGDYECESGCGASTECDEENIGYNIGNAGCNVECSWFNCGLYKWNNPDTPCYESCTDNSVCFLPAVCDLIGADINECVNDITPSIVTALTPLNDTRFNTNNIPYSFSVSDDADLVLACKYSLNNANVSVGSVNNGGTYSNNIILSTQNWYNLIYYCLDDAGNEGVSDALHFLFDQNPANYYDFNVEDITPTVDNTLITGDLLNISAYWVDNFDLSTSELFYDDGTPGWHSAGIINHESISNMSLFIFNTSSFGDTNLKFKIKTVDSAGNEAETTPFSVFVNNPSNEISITLRESGGNITNVLEFLGNAQAVNSRKAEDSGSTALIGDFRITHEGIGTTIRNVFSLNESLPAGIYIKISGGNNPASAVILTTSPQVMSFCNSMVPDDTCDVWVWMQLDEAVPPVIELNNIIIESETI
ncbi:hypothetical protein COS83_02425 [archaeon CG07_land_8_20_14_0_80_38_8]|nr:MAG: hypothetical protein COS83_02425 [archaeon CG07_land_8_20_14_0_80_38_8]